MLHNIKQLLRKKKIEAFMSNFKCELHAPNFTLL